MSIPTIKLNNGLEIPTMGLGTLKIPLQNAKQIVMEAIDMGYRLFDCAYIYENESEIGKGIRAKIDDGTVTREELTICTKIQLGTIPIPKTMNKRRLKANIQVFNFNITAIDMEKIDTLNHNIRHYLFLEAEQHEHYPFGIYWNRQ